MKKHLKGTKCETKEIQRGNKHFKFEEGTEETAPQRKSIRWNRKYHIQT